MFRGIAGALNKRNKAVVLTDQSDKKAKQAFQEFLLNEFGDIVLEFRISIEFDRRMDGFVIVAPNKTIATEINLKIESLRKRLEDKGLKTSRLIVR